MEQTRPVISVIIPIYQVEKYILKCISSVIDQSYRNLEIILVDDGSTDGCPQICDEYEKIDYRIKVIHTKNEGLSSARNKGLDIAKGEYVAFVDSDDYVDKRYVEVMYEIAQTTNCEIVQCGHCNIIDDDSNHKSRIDKPVIYTPEEFACSTYTILSWQCSLSWNKLYKRVLFNDIRFPLKKIHEDEFTTYKVTWKAKKIAVIHAQLYFYRQRTDSITGKEYSLDRLDAGKAYREREIFYKEKEKFTLYKMVQNFRFNWIEQQIVNLKKMKKNNQEIIDKLVKEKNTLEENISEITKLSTSLTLNGYLFPFSEIEFGSKIILYGAGDVGIRFKRQIMASNYCDVVLWVDANYLKYKEFGLHVESKDKIIKYRNEFDYLIIAINNDKVASEIIHELIGVFGISRCRIIYKIVKI